ncbi:deoxyribose-phosphate aldolase [Brachyspira pilosicoli WesB]|uniref:Deoxyribose-phosphate aldolase n=1 Tax=Brachyspira pilosicoli WesB TaxID=1161918 RepID=K0JKV5_BRAPL|nr:deoxyribose-phosphate aldolase [Brachyspira pilosicoli]MBW5397359.1 deoxyribose-phosphate aldolase [Brachyspira pilosicoli]CCG57654.1 deoxyribose-phosphate aldolase [Brachyspira pilosicoli WesB]
MNNISQLIDSTILRPDASENDIKILCEDALKYSFCSVCINPTWIKYSKNILNNSGVKVCTVIGFPLGAATTEMKYMETRNAIENGADEIDMVINIGLLKSKSLDSFKEDILKVREASKDKILKVIIEACLLTEEEKKISCEISKELKADFVKTSTGFSTYGAKVEDVRLMRNIVGGDMGVKAAGGIKTLSDVKAMIEAGANRIGTSNAVNIIKEIK